MKFGSVFFIVIGILQIIGCNDADAGKVTGIIYDNDFDASDSKIEGELLSISYGDSVIGPFNNSGFTLYLDDIPEHEYLIISFELYIDGSWDGNRDTIIDIENEQLIVGPDFWIMELDEWIENPRDKRLIYRTTFGRGPDKLQSHPEKYPFFFNSSAGSQRRKYKNHCSGSTGSTDLYFVEKTFYHTSHSLALKFYDRTIDPPAVADPICNESWAMGNLRIKAWN